MSTLSDDEPRIPPSRLTFPAGSPADTRWMQGGNEPILTASGDRIVDSHGRVSRVTTAGGGPSVGKHLLLGYLPPEYAQVGTELNVMYMNELFPVRVAATTGSVFDPDDIRLKS